jgi:7-cyano-7-deazaguanine synthase
MNHRKKRAIILLSGGLDSATCLAIATSRNYECYTLSIDYGQRHCSELHAAAIISQQFNASEHKVVSLDLRLFGGSALTDSSIEVPTYTGAQTIPSTYVPARNTIFFSLALGYAEVMDAEGIFTGINAVDYSGYPDCRPEYLQAFQTMADYATQNSLEGRKITYYAPLLYLSKQEIIQIGVRLGLDYSQTISCYRADENGLACGTCDSCVLRKKGFNMAGIKDPTRYTHSD